MSITEGNMVEAEAMERGIKKGEKNEKIKIAKSMLTLKVDIGIIVKSTGLTKEEIEKLKL